MEEFASFMGGKRKHSKDEETEGNDSKRRKTDNQTSIPNFQKDKLREALRKELGWF